MNAPVNLELENRSFVSEIRAQGRRLQGYAATFGIEARIGGRFTETIAQGAFSQSLSDAKDILALVDHDPSKVLARTRSGTLVLNEDATGLAFDIQVPDTQAGRDILALASRGDLGGMSFGFQALDEEINGDHRVLRNVILHEISVVSAWPAYEGTSISARSRLMNSNFIEQAKRRIKILELSL